MGAGMRVFLATNVTSNDGQALQQGEKGQILSSFFGVNGCVRIKLDQHADEVWVRQSDVHSLVPADIERLADAMEHFPQLFAVEHVEMWCSTPAELADVARVLRCCPHLRSCRLMGGMPNREDVRALYRRSCGVTGGTPNRKDVSCMHHQACKLTGGMLSRE